MGKHLTNAVFHRNLPGEHDDFRRIMIEIIAFDADDTLWHNETTYHAATTRFEKLLATHYGLTDIEGELYETEKENLGHFGYGVKSYTISMIETAVRPTNGRIHGRHILEIISVTREMLKGDIQLLPDAEEIVSLLAESYPLMLVTKGDQFEQEGKIKRSGLASYFERVEIVSEKTIDTYSALFNKHGVDPAGFLMIGNSMRSDITPVISLGGQAVYIPYDLTWEHEMIHDEPSDGDHYYQIEGLDELPALVSQLDST